MPNHTYFSLGLSLTAVFIFSAINSSNCQVNEINEKEHETSLKPSTLKCHMCADCFDIPEAPNLPLAITQDMSFINSEFGGCKPASKAIPVTETFQKFSQAGYPSLEANRTVAMSDSIFCTNMSIVFGNSTVVIRSVQMIHEKSGSSSAGFCTSDLGFSDQTAVGKALRDLEASATRLNFPFSFTTCQCQDSDGCNSDIPDCDDTSDAYGTIVARSVSSVLWLFASVLFLGVF